MHKVALRARCSDTLNARLLSADLAGTMKWTMQGLRGRGEQQRRQHGYLLEHSSAHFHSITSTQFLKSKKAQLIEMYGRQTEIHLNG